MKRKVLGRGLEALIPEVKAAGTPVSEIDIDRISPNPNQPRLVLDEQRLEELAGSIRENGVLQPVLIRPFGKSYQLVAGERRLAAAQRAGLMKIPAIVREVPDDRLLELSLVENIQREPLNPMEEAQAYQKLIETIHQTQEQVAQRLGKDRSTVANSLRLLKLPHSVQVLVSEGKLSPGHARALLSSNANPSEMSKIAAAMVQRGWSVRQAERWAKRRSGPSRSPKPQNPNEAAAADRLRLSLGTKVEIVAKSGNKGEIRIHYFNQEELMRLYSILIGRANSTEPDHAIQEAKRSQ
jgi:ParB family chromosome partitioning protein